MKAARGPWSEAGYRIICYTPGMRLKLPVAFCAVVLLGGVSQGQQWGPWHVAGPFEHRGGPESLSQRHAPEKELPRMYLGGGGPDLANSHRGENGVEVRWREIAGGSTAFDVGGIDLRVQVPAVPGKANWADDSAAYLYRRAVMATDRDVRVHLGSDAGVKVWLNGALVLERASSRGVDLYDEALILPMREGVNHLLVMVVNGKGAWGFRIGPWRTPNAIEIDKAIERAVQYFLDHQLIDGSWGYMGHIEPGPTAFRLYTLLKCGLPLSHPAIQRARAFVLANHDDATYPLSAVIMALAEMNLEGDRERIEGLLEELWDNQLENGLFLYSVDGYNSHLARGDLSNVLFAGLAMRAASQVGIAINSNRWTKLAKGVLSCWQRPDGVPRTGGRAEPRGFSYTPGRAPTSSMVVAGVSLLAIVDEQAGDRIVGKTRNQVKAGIRTGLAWLDEHFAWGKNVGHPSGHHNFFSIYGMERVGGLLDLSVVANRDWYFEGSRFLLSGQAPNGTWSEKGGHVETELALLFLKRATARSSGPAQSRKKRVWSTAGDPDAAVALRGIGDTPATIWVESVHEGRLPDLEWKGQTGLGPHVVHVEYFARRDSPGARTERIGFVMADSSVPKRGERYAVQHRFPANGTWLVHARVTCLKELTAEGVSQEEVELPSAEMEIVVRNVITEEQLAYAGQARKNLLRGIQVHARASSEIKGEEAKRAFDGRHQTRWHCALKDRSPKLKLALGRAVRGQKVVLSHGWPMPAYGKSPRPLRGELVVNGRVTFPWEMDPDPMTKTTIDLASSYRIRSLEISITETLYGELGNGAFGFSEVEVYGRR